MPKQTHKSTINDRGFNVSISAFLLTFLCCSLLSLPVRAAVTYRVPKVDSTVHVDGILDDAVWTNAVKIDANIEVRPGENIPAPVKMEVLLAYNESHVFVAFKAYDPDPSQIRAHITDRDNIWDDDWVLILFDTFNDQRRSYDFFCNPYGIQADEIETSDGGGGSWDAIWDSAGRITDEGYIVEMAIPFRALNFQPGDEDQIWSFDAVRSYPRTVRHHIGAFPRDRNNNCYLCQAEKLTGFSGVKPGRNIDIATTFSTGGATERDELDGGGYGPMKETDRRIDPGITARWGVTPNINISFTANPDFSQVEADAAQMDINTRFPLYYSEKRPFFIDNVDIFNTGDRLVHTRTLADPDWGLRLTGKEGKNTFGLFTVRDSYTPLVFSGTDGADNTTLSMQSTGTVLRYKRDVGKSSYLGILATDRESEAYHNRLGGFDARFKFTPKNQFNAQYFCTNTRYPDETSSEFDQKSGDFGGFLYNIELVRYTDKYSVYGLTKAISPGFRSDLGFITQTGYRYNEIGCQYMWRNGPEHWYNWLSIYTGYDLMHDWNNNPLFRRVMGNFNYNGPLQSWFGMEGRHDDERYNNTDFRMNSFDVWGGLRPVSSLQLSFNCRAGDGIDYDNTRAGTVLNSSQWATFYIGRRLSFNLGNTVQKLDVPQGRLFTANVGNFKTMYNFTSRMFLRVNLQYTDYRRNTSLYNDSDVESRTRKLASQILIAYKINPQTMFFLGYSDNYNTNNFRDSRGEPDNSVIQTNRAVFTKIGYSLQM
ncbi:carbohydrate binding family 9 domain-containing protein [bacterium]|nr:carbohydrate binding family 9 domain-containing protein [bacterium]